MNHRLQVCEPENMQLLRMTKNNYFIYFIQNNDDLGTEKRILLQIQKNLKLIW